MAAASRNEHPNNAPGVPMKFPPLVERLQIKYFNPMMRPLARFLPTFAVVKHRGRKSGQEYETVVNAFRYGNALVIALVMARRTGSRTCSPPARRMFVCSGATCTSPTRRALPAGSDDPALPRFMPRGAKTMGVFVADIA